jgi:hypothetical protein
VELPSALKLDSRHGPSTTDQTGDADQLAMALDWLSR